MNIAKEITNAVIKTTLKLVLKQRKVLDNNKTIAVNHHFLVKAGCWEEVTWKHWKRQFLVQKTFPLLMSYPIACIAIYSTVWHAYNTSVRWELSVDSWQKLISRQLKLCRDHISHMSPIFTSNIHTLSPCNKNTPSQSSNLHLCFSLRNKHGSDGVLCGHTLKFVIVKLTKGL